jgi:hypothetical protein
MVYWPLKQYARQSINEYYILTIVMKLGQVKPLVGRRVCLDQRRRDANLVTLVVASTGLERCSYFASSGAARY